MSVRIHELEAAARREFAFLESEFGCALEPAEHEPWWRRLIYRSNTGHAEIYLDERDEIVSVYFGPAGGRRLPLWAVIDARGEPRPADTDVAGWARALRRHGAPALGGDDSGYRGIDEAIERHGEQVERTIRGHLEEQRARRAAEPAWKRALRRLWSRLP